LFSITAGLCGKRGLYFSCLAGTAAKLGERFADTRGGGLSTAKTWQRLKTTTGAAAKPETRLKFTFF
jgi:hypothetical protein